MRFVVDMNLPIDWAPALISAGFAARHWAEVGPPTASDFDVLAWASDNDAVVITRDLDFGTLLAREARRKPSVVQFRIDQVRLARDLPLLLDALARYRAHLSSGAIVTIRSDRTRVRVLGASPRP
jgi:predicted nuclease of predicted toxin-antitoxin system